VRRHLAAAPVEVHETVSLGAESGLSPFMDTVRRVGPDVIHLDSYTAPERLGELLESAGSRAVLSNLEDGPFGRRHADVVIDPTFAAELSARTDDGSTWMLSGARYALLRGQVVSRRGSWRQSSGHVRSVLVVMGGTDPLGLAPPVVAALGQTGLSMDVTVIAAGDRVEAVTQAAKASNGRLALHVLPPTDDLAALMVASDVVVSAAGTSVWELCCIGVPMALVQAVKNQAEGYAAVVGEGAALGLGGPVDVLDTMRTALALRDWCQDSVKRQAHARVAGGLVDGLGAWRVVQTWEQALRLGTVSPQEPPQHQRMAVRPASLQDARLLWEWRNDPATRASSRSSADIPFEDHLRWLTTSLGRKDRLLLLVEDDDGPIGTVRWDLDRPGEWEVSITVAPSRRGQSLARPLLRAAEVALTEMAGAGGTGVTAYLAAVHVDNRASIRLFETSAYVPDLPPDPRGFMRFRKATRVT
jgi:spore coat polysaccharide biosynthesis predicted glycosyltransferase SpsG/RimJ/RimL family protein N-acetyltransferase